jgi:acyl-CoA thioesterase-2
VYRLNVGEKKAQLRDLLELEPIEENIFRGASLDETWRRVFGGQVAAQALVAAGQTVELRRVHSLHAYFLRPGDSHRPILYEVERIRDGASFSTRWVVGIQNGKTIFGLMCSFHRAEEGLVHGDRIPPAPDPQELPTLDEALAARDEGPVPAFANTYGLDIRFVTEYPWQRDGRPSDKEQLWLRATGSIGDDPLIHAAILTFASDLTLVDTILQRHGRTPFDEHFVGASLDHSLWFHRPFRADEWLFYDQTSPVAFGGRGLARGLLFSQQGDLVASAVQEGLVRLKTAR